jgi:hypothetical protein
MKKIIFLFLVAGLHASAQVPGYMGQRMLAGASFLFGSPEVFQEDPATVRSSKKGEGYGIGLHEYYKVSAEYVIGEKTSLYAAYKFSKFGFRHEYDINYSTYYYLTQLNTGTIDIALKKHLLGNIAPLGNYFSYGLSFTTATEKDVLGNSKIASEPFVPRKVRFGSLFFNYGHNIYIGNNLILNTQLETNFANPIYLINEDNDFKYQVVYRWQKSVWLNFGLGLSYILF